MKTIGITGGMGSGKSTVSTIMKKYGGYVIDADQINHEIMKKHNPAYQEIVNFFGEDILLQTREIDRKKLAEQVFGNDALSKNNLKILTDINHKYVVMETLDQIKQIKKNDNHSFIVIDAPLLVEAELHKICYKVIVLYSDLEIRIQRIKNRDGLPADEILKRIENQMPFDELKQFADYILVNNTTDQDLENNLKSILCSMNIVPKPEQKE